MNGTAHDRVLEALTDAGCRVSNGGTASTCPAHEDNAPSLSIGIRRDRDGVLLNCHAGCETAAVLAALGMSEGDLFDEPRQAASTSRPRIVATYDYVDEIGTLLYQKVRLEPKSFRQRRPDGNGWAWSLGDAPRALYRLPDVLEAIGSGLTVFVCEGEKDADALTAAGVTATTWTEGAWKPGQSAKWRREYTDALAGARVVIVGDRDDPGRHTAVCIGQALQGVTSSVRIVEAAEGKDAADHLAAGRTVDELLPVDTHESPPDESAVASPPTGDEEDDPAARARRMFPRLDWHALWADDVEDEWLHVPLLPARRSVVVYSPPKVGKSLLMLEFAVALSLAGVFLGHKIERRIRVLYVDFENDPRGDIRSRLQAMGYGPDDLDDLIYLSFPTMAGLDTERGSLEMLEAVKAYDVEVVIIDTVSRAVDGEENSNDTWLGLYRHTGLKLKQAGVSVIRLDHTGKDEAKGQRGGSAKSGDVDAVWRLTRITDVRFRLECTDSRMQIETKSLHVIRQHTPRLRHVAEVLGGMTDRESKVAHLVKLCDTNGLPADANREALRVFAKGRGISARNDVLAEVMRARKSVPDRGDSTEPGQGRNRADAPGTCWDTLPTSPEPEHETSTSSVPRGLGTAGDSGTSPTVPVAAVRSTATWGQRDETSTCPTCAGPIEELREVAGLDCLACHERETS